MEVKIEDNGGKKENVLLTLFLTMLKIGSVTFGGGYAIMPIIKNELVDKRGWMESEEMFDILALSETIPGAVCIDTAIMTGYKLDKIKGAVVAATGLVLPSLITVTIVTYIYQSLPADSIIWTFMAGVRAGVIGLMLSAFITIALPILKNKFSWILFIVAFLLSVLTPIHPLLIILPAGLIGYLYMKFWRKNDGNPI